MRCDYGVMCMNVILTSVGRRAYMVKYFKDVLGDIRVLQRA